MTTSRRPAADRDRHERRSDAHRAAFALSAASRCRSRRPIAPHPPQPGPPPSLKLPAIQKQQLSNGLPVWIVELHKVPVVQVNLVVLQRQRPTIRPASSASPSLTAAMLDEGAGSRSALEIADAVDFLGADLGDERRHRLRRRSGCTCRSRGSPTRCRSWPTWRCGPTFPQRRARAAAPAAADEHAAGARRSGDDRRARVLARPLRRQRIATAPP